ncbi:hypothetical protein B0H13DRAFT_2340354 [Mycena leptocephala]|nr:hypothetical protein B0H13DRAFT_2340354 [Mycena leptocephala]
MSHSSTPTLPWVLPMYEAMLKHLRSSKDNETMPEYLRTAAAVGLDKLEVYGVRLSIIIYRNMQVLFPRFQQLISDAQLVFHLSLGITWLRKSELFSATRAQILFEHAYNSYQQIYASSESSQSQPRVKPSRPGTLGSFLDDIRMRFWDAFKNYSGDCNAPPMWWNDHINLSQVRLNNSRCDVKQCSITDLPEGPPPATALPGKGGSTQGEKAAFNQRCKI